MKPSFDNKEIIEGYVYQHSLIEKEGTTQGKSTYGQKYITGTLDVATDENCSNVLQIRYSCVKQFTNAGKESATYRALKAILEENKTVLANGKENAHKVRCQPSGGLREFYSTTNQIHVTQQINEGGFVSLIDVFDLPEKKRNEFKFDMIITNVNHVNADQERGIQADFVEVKGAIFGYLNKLRPFTVVVHQPDGMAYFEGLDASPATPVFTHLWGNIISTSIQIEKRIESAFGEAAVDMTSRRVREWEITGVLPDTPPFDDPATITVDELKTLQQNRAIEVAEIKKNSEEYAAKRKEQQAASPLPFSDDAMPIPEGGFTMF